MAYRADPGLEFLETVPSENLEDLVNILIYDSDGEPRFTEELRKVGLDPKSNPKPDYHQYWKEIAAEIQLFGGNSLMSLLKGGYGVEYKEILCDVCDRLDVNYNKFSSIERIEDSLQMKILQDALERMSPNEIKTLGTELGLDNISKLNSQTFTAIFQAIFTMGGFKSYQLTLKLVNLIWRAIAGKGLTFAANHTLTKTMSVLTGPIGLAITAIWTMVDIAGPAYRVTIPAVLQVAYLRKLSTNLKEVEEMAKKAEL